MVVELDEPIYCLGHLPQRSKWHQAWKSPSGAQVFRQFCGIVVHCKKRILKSDATKVKITDLKKKTVQLCTIADIIFDFYELLILRTI